MQNSTPTFFWNRLRLDALRFLRLCGKPQSSPKTMIARIRGAHAARSAGQLYVVLTPPRVVVGALADHIFAFHTSCIVLALNMGLGSAVVSTAAFRLGLQLTPVHRQVEILEVRKSGEGSE